MKEQNRSADQEQGSISACVQVVLMSATLDSKLFAQYFGGCASLAAGGRTFPVEQHFLEDVYEMTEYVLDTEGPAALRLQADAARRKALQKAASGPQGLLKVSRETTNVLQRC